MLKNQGEAMPKSIHEKGITKKRERQSQETQQQQMKHQITAAETICSESLKQNSQTRSINMPKLVSK